jgi:hypothetical protein
MTRTVHKRQTTFFLDNTMPDENWGWVVEFRYLDPEIGDGKGEWECPPRPNHFRLEANAAARVVELSNQFKDAIRLKMVEFRFQPKYLGYVPPEDETWIV